MADLFLHGREITTVFQLLGDKENDITFSLGWALARCETFLEMLTEQLLPGATPGSSRATSTVSLQEAGEDRGYTDVEIVTERAHIIIEAKRGWNLPSDAQLARYVGRFASKRSSVLAVMAECLESYAATKLPRDMNGVPVRYLSWQQVMELAERSTQASSHAEKRLLREFVAYLSGLISMQNQKSNEVFVVSLGADRPSWSELTWREMVTKQNRYFHPISGKGGWPKVPPNYLGFRYDGRLQSIRHVDSYVVVTDARGMTEGLPGVDGDRWWQESENAALPHFLYSLGPAIVPPHEVPNGRSIQMANRVWAAIDLLLTCSSISEAAEKTRLRTRAETML